MSEQRIGVRIDGDLKEKVEEVAGSRGESLSTFVRRSILKELAGLTYLSVEEKKALGLEGRREPESSESHHAPEERGTERR